MRILLIDNYDSFTYNLAQYLGELGAAVDVRRNDALDLEGARKLNPDAIVLSPGPGHPGNRRDFGVCSDLLLKVSRDVPTLGICLGHQGIAHFYGGKVTRASNIMHGKVSMIEHKGGPLYDGIPSPFLAGRYHSLIVDPLSMPSGLEVTAHTNAGEVMGLRHRSFPIEGVQFHPESVLTPNGKVILANFIHGARR
jgi:anthranilate synthase/aminodeoxychorismate synthase-like glutamine amidotransferase